MRKTLSYRLEARRAELGLTHADAAENMGVARSTYDEWQNGAHPNWSHIDPIADYLDKGRKKVMKVIHDDYRANPR